MNITKIDNTIPSTLVAAYKNLESQLLSQLMKHNTDQGLFISLDQEFLLKYPSARSFLGILLTSSIKCLSPLTIYLPGKDNKVAIILI
jgi:hypothetical protein